MKEIREWLANGQDYALGLALYETHGRSRVVLTALRRGASDFTRQKLRVELEKLIASPASSRPPATRVVDQPTPGPKPGQPASTPPPPVAPAPEHPARRTWYATRSYQHAQLELVATDAERLALCADILGLSETITASYQASPELPADAALPEPDWAALTDAGEIRRLLANLRPQRTKLRKRPHRAGELARVEHAITLLEEKLKRDGEPQLHPRN